MEKLSLNDDRVGLASGNMLVITQEQNSNSYGIRISCELGRGANCIVYKGILKSLVEGTEVESLVVVKELFPKGLGIRRRSDTDFSLIIPSEKESDFYEIRSLFGHRFVSYSDYVREQEERGLTGAFVYGSANSTVYAFFSPPKGEILSETDTSELSLNHIAAIMEGICRSLRSLHIKEKLYLDLKPANILFDISDNDLQALVYIIDFDTIQKLRDIRLGLCKGAPFSYGWSPPEQKCAGGDGQYMDPSLLGYHTDIYSAGALFFYLLTGRRAEERDISEINSGTFAWKKESAALQKSSDEAVKLSKTLLKSMLEPDPVKRRESFGNYLSVRELEKDFARIYGVTAGNDLHFEPLHDSLEVVVSELRQLKEMVSELKGIIEDGRK